jgi:hypothetical protein
MIGHLKSFLIVFIFYFCSLFLVGYLQNFYLNLPILLLVQSLGFGPRTVEQFLAAWFLLALPNVVCGAIIGKYVPWFRQLYIAPVTIFLFYWVSVFMYLWSKSFIWVCDSWNLLFVTAIAGIIAGIIKRKDLKPRPFSMQ